MIREACKNPMLIVAFIVFIGLMICAWKESK